MNEREDILDSNECIRIIPLVDTKIIIETCSRIGIANKKRKILYPSVYLWQNFSDFYLLHFKTLFTLTRVNGYKNLSEEDIERKNSIIFILKTWGLIDVPDSNIEPHNKYVFVLPFNEKKSWDIQHKFNISNTEILK